MGPRRGLGDRGRGARRPARNQVGALGRGRRLRAARGLEGVEDRRARYVCELVALSPAGEERRGTGTVEGTVGFEPRGTEGFGYDPIFVPLGETKTVAELGNDWKREHSHRAVAAKALAGAFERK